jgi:hypothetical protein
MAAERQKVVQLASLGNNLLALRTADIAVGVNQSGRSRGGLKWMCVPGLRV